MGLQVLQLSLLGLELLLLLINTLVSSLLLVLQLALHTNQLLVFAD